ncbi:hypothetical protein GCM10009765_15600 [Fodinicola feengrottensis]|uniref:Uncharacterized protein n=1 Tax=Fodinicola feengrottensis TaxID=435914 RepID=A0ABN2G879_9ACTN
MTTPDPIQSQPRAALPAATSPKVRSRFARLVTIQDKDETKSFWEKTADAGAKFAITLPTRVALAGGLALNSGSWELITVLGAGVAVDVAWTIVRSKLKDQAAIEKREAQLAKKLDVDTDPLEQHKEARDRIDALEQAVAEHSEPVAKIESLEGRQLDQGQKLGQVVQAVRMDHNKLEAQGEQLSAVRQQMQHQAAQQNQLQNDSQQFFNAVREAFDQQNQHFDDRLKQTVEQQNQYFEQRVQQAVAEQVPQAVAAEVQRLLAAGVLAPVASQQQAVQQGQQASGPSLQGRQTPASIGGDNGPPPVTRKGPLRRFADSIDRLQGREPKLTPNEQWHKDRNEQAKEAGRARDEAAVSERQQGANPQPAVPYQSVHDQNAPAAPWQAGTGHGYTGPEPKLENQADQAPSEQPDLRQPLNLGQSLTPRASKKGPKK